MLSIIYVTIKFNFMESWDDGLRLPNNFSETPPLFQLVVVCVSDFFVVIVKSNSLSFDAL